MMPGHARSAHIFTGFRAWLTLGIQSLVIKNPGLTRGPSPYSPHTPLLPCVYQTKMHVCQVLIQSYKSTNYVITREHVTLFSGFFPPYLQPCKAVFVQQNLLEACLTGYEVSWRKQCNCKNTGFKITVKRQEKEEEKKKNGGEQGEKEKKKTLASIQLSPVGLDADPEKTNWGFRQWPHNSRWHTTHAKAWIERMVMLFTKACPTLAWIPCETTAVLIQKPQSPVHVIWLRYKCQV